MFKRDLRKRLMMEEREDLIRRNKRLVKMCALLHLSSSHPVYIELSKNLKRIKELNERL